MSLSEQVTEKFAKCEDFKVESCAIFDRSDRIVLKQAPKTNTIALLSLGRAERQDLAKFLSNGHISLFLNALTTFDGFAVFHNCFK